MVEPDAENINNPGNGAGSGVTDVAMLVKKHNATIKVILDLPQSEQKQFFIDHGIDPQKLISEHYPDLVKRSEELRLKNQDATRKASKAGKIALFATGIPLAFLNKKYFSNQPFVKWLAVIGGSLTSGILTYFAATKILTRDIRVPVEKSAFASKKQPAPKASEELAMAARKAMERELAVILENDELNDKVYVIADGIETTANYKKALSEDREFAAKFRQQQGKAQNQQSGSHVQKLNDQDAANAANQHVSVH